MATFPHNLCGIRQDGHAEQHTPVVLRSEVERGMPRQRRTSADALVSVPCTLVFRSAAAAAEFEAWYYAEGFGWFDFTLPRTGAVVQARIVGGDIGGLTPITPAWNASERSITLEYRRPGFIQLPPGLHSVNPARVLSVQRNSTATYVDDAGLLQTAAANVARYQGGLMLVEGEATNLCLYSQNLSVSPWSGILATPTSDLYQGFAPFWEIKKASSLAFESIVQSIGSAESGDFLTMTAAFLSGTGISATVGLYDASSGSYWGGWGDGSAEVVSGPGTLTRNGGSIAFLDSLHPTIPTVIRISRLYQIATPSAWFLIYPGSDGSTTIGASVKSTRVQIVRSQIESSYIPTTTAPATRAADIVTVAA